MGYSFQGYIDDVVQPTIMETVFVKNLQPALDLFNKDPNPKGGPNIVKDICVSESYPTRNYDRTDVNPVPGYFENVQASWTREYQDTSYEVHGIDISQAQGDGLKQIQNLIQYESNKAFKALRQKIFNNFFTQLALDIDDTTAFSDNSLSRSTYPTLASQVHDTDTAITLAIARATKFSTQLNKNVDKGSYIWLVEPTVNKTFQELLGATRTWAINDATADGKFAAGYQEAASFDGDRVIEMTGMTVGDMYFLNPNDIYIDNHMPLEIEQVESGKHAYRFVMRIGYNLWTDNPGHQAKLTDKD